MTKTYKIKLEDKAAFLNRLEKAEVDVNNYKVADNKLEGYFTITFSNINDIIKVQTILKQSPNINNIKEMLRAIVKEELKKSLEK